jgi:hypothetical protein
MGTGRMDDITYVGLDVHKPALAKAGATPLSHPAPIPALPSSLR